MNLRLSGHIFTMEIRKAFAYRTDFWLSFVVSTLAQFAVAWFLWKSIFAYTGKATIGTFTFPSLMFYYLLSPVIGRTVYGGNFGDIAAEIYQGTLTRYLVYPVSFFRYKLIVHCANASILVTQLVLIIIGTRLFFPSFTAAYDVNFLHILQGLVTTLAAAVLYHLFASWIQLIAFWADQVWSLSAIVRFITGLLGGGLLPIALFPATMQPVLKILPFSFFVHFPLQCFLGNISLLQWSQGLAVMTAWGAVFGAIYAIVWQRGNISYSGVGI
jgi:ABC-2 type transport system permease protein